MSRTLVVAEAALRELLRRRTVLVILLLMPLAFYLSRRGDHLGQSIRFVCLGLGWALSTAALFAGSAASNPACGSPATAAGTWCSAGCSRCGPSACSSPLRTSCSSWPTSATSGMARSP